MALRVYRFRRELPTDVPTLENLAGAGVSSVDHAGGAVFDLRIDDTQAADLVEALVKEGFTHVETDPTSSPQDALAGIAPDGKIKVSADDDTYDYLEQKLVAGSGITLTVLDPGAAETLSVAASSTALPVAYQSAVSLARSTTTSTSFQTKLTLVITAGTGTYRVGWCAVVDSVSANRLVTARLYDVTDAVVVGVEQTHRPTLSSEDVPVGAFDELVMTGSARTVRIEFRSPQGTTVGIQNARIEVWRVS